MCLCACESVSVCVCVCTHAIAKTDQIINYHNTCVPLISQDRPMMESHVFAVAQSLQSLPCDGPMVVLERKQ